LNPDDEEKNQLEKMDAIIRVEMGIDPNNISDTEWAKLFQEWVYVQRVKNNALEKILEKTFTEALFKVAKAIFAKK
jgi:hypothetical protein